MSKNHWVRGAWAVAAIMATGVASAALPQQTSNDSAGGQAPGTTNRQGNWNQQSGHAMAGHTDVDHFLIKVLIQANQDEIATGRLAQQRSSNADVKKLAMQIVDDHTRFMSQLQQFQNERRGNSRPGQSQRGFNNNSNTGTSSSDSNTGTSTSSSNNGTSSSGSTTGTPSSGTVNGSATSGTATSNIQSQPGSDTNAVAQSQNPTPETLNQPGARARRFGSPMAGHTDMAGRRNAAHQFVKVMEDVSSQTQQSIQRELSQKEGAQFDRCYLAWQELDHIWLVAALTVFERDASPALRPILQEGLQTAQGHLAHCKALLSRIEQAQPKSTAERQSGGFGTR